MKLIYTLVVLWILICCTTADAMADSAYPFQNNLDNKKFHALIQQIRCVMCLNQTIAESEAPLAQDMRGKIYRLVLAQQSEAEIKDFLAKRYGEFILLKPRWNLITAPLWLFPFIGLLLIGIGCYFMIRKIY